MTGQALVQWALRARRDRCAAGSRLARPASHAWGPGRRNLCPTGGCGLRCPPISSLDAAGACSRCRRSPALSIRPVGSRSVRSDPRRLRFEITARDGAARSGRIHTPSGVIETPAFIPLATRGSVRSLTAAEVADLGFQMVLGNTFHLMLSPGAERIAGLGGLHRFMGWERAIITDSGGFQVFSLAHGNVADEVKGRRGKRSGQGSVLEIGEEGVRFRSYVDGSERFLGPEESMEIQGQLGSDIALAFDECTPYHADRDYTARS